MPKFFVSPNQIVDDIISISGDDARHMKTVLRYRVGDELVICDGKGFDYNCKIAGFEDGNIQASIDEKIVCEAEAKTKIVLYQGLPKADKMEIIIQKCTEIGVTRIVPVATRNAVAKLSGKEEKKIERWQKIAEAAAKQSGRGLIPLVGPEALSFAQAVDEGRMLSAALIPYEKQGEKEKSFGIKEFASGFSGETLAVFIGPEGGFTTEEIELAVKNGLRPITLGKRILRTETAGLVASALLIHELG